MKTALLILAFSSLPLFAVELPADAAALKGKRDAKISEINQLYANELGKLQKVALKNANLEAANAIEKEIASVVVNPLAGGKAGEPSFVGSWEVTNSKNSRVKRLFTSTHLIDEVGDKHPYKLSGNTITIEWGHGWEKLTIDPAQPDVLNGFNNGGLSLRYSRKS